MSVDDPTDKALGVPELVPLWCALEEVMEVASEMGNHLDPAVLKYLDASLELNDAMQELQDFCPALLDEAEASRDEPTTLHTILARLDALRASVDALIQTPQIGALAIGTLTRVDLHVLAALRMVGGVR